ncbi:hypothetical protein [Alkaliphilus transvaalensis]|uniref:hypothetical protein n=1 Tax=Alkaliphilus transvaalensis TaxID=114628 RepID=UPI0006886946|nr:hypothetical protein [Alkaliphilus transvaalensis]
MEEYKVEEITLEANIDVVEQVDRLKKMYLELWWNTRVDFPYIDQTIRLIDQYSNGKKIDGFIKTFSKELKNVISLNKNKNWSNQLATMIRDFESSMVGYQQCCVDFFIEKGYAKITEDFLNEVRNFDHEIEVYDIFQAIRNVWIMNSLQVIFGNEVSLTPSIFAYSMLYPYSDNYLDNQEVGVEEKIKFNDRFKERLEGNRIKATSDNEAKIYKLVAKIEAQFSRTNYKEVFDSLLAIHSAQINSLSQQRGRILPYEGDIIGITFEKGGTSVLADGYLIKGKLTEDEAKFTFGYGVFLQLIDDLQDVEEDYQNGHMTIFSQILGKWPLDLLVNKLFAFINEIIYEESTLKSTDAMKVKDVIHESCKIMILEAISKNKKYFSRSYIRQLEKYSLLRFSYFKKIKRKLNKSFSEEELNKICSTLGEGNINSLGNV